MRTILASFSAVNEKVRTTLMVQSGKPAEAGTRVCKSDLRLAAIAFGIW